MNYRHAYHAGGIADVFKHVVLIGLLTRLMQKESALFVLDTHAGTGLYDLSATEPGKTREFEDGIGKLFPAAASSPLLARYLRQVHAYNPNGALTFYPGSPLLIASILRPQDRAAFCELHAQDAATLRRTLRPYSNAAAHRRDGYEAIGALLPAREKRGLVLIDPPFEAGTELRDAAKALRLAHNRFPQATLAFWYPVKERPALWRFEEEMIASGIRNQLTIEFMVRDEGDSRNLNGSGMLLVDPPWQVEEELRLALDELKELAVPQTGKVAFKMLAGE